MIYLDNCATTKPRREVIEEMVKVLETDFANPSSLHSFGHEIEKKINVARQHLANLLNISDKEIYFTSGGTESNNIAINGLIKKNKRNGNKIITTSVEHSSVMKKILEYEKLGYEVIKIGVDEKANIDLNKLYESIDDCTILVSLVHVNNEIGTITPIKDIISKIKEINKDVFVHIDGVQSCGKLPVNLVDINCDSYSLSGHKFYGPKGVGALYIKKSIKIDPLVLGGGQENNLRSGTENVPGIIGMGVAAKIISQNFKAEYSYIKDLKEYLLESLNNSLDDFIINSPKNSSPYILSISINNIRAEVLLHYLEQDNIYVSTASACTSNGTRKSRVLEEMGLSNSYADGTIRICLANYITKKDIDMFVEKLISYTNEIRDIMKRG